MPLFTSSRTITSRRASISDYNSRLECSIADSLTSPEERKVLKNEKSRWEKMTEKEQKRWVDFKLGNGWKGRWRSIARLSFSVAD